MITADDIVHRATIKSFAAAMLDYFGKAGKDTQGFMAEFKALSDEDKFELRDMLKNEGYNI
jgi:hypothetical protein